MRKVIKVCMYVNTTVKYRNGHGLLNMQNNRNSDYTEDYGHVSPQEGASDSYIFNCVNNKMLESDWFLAAHIYNLIITIFKFSNLVGCQLS